MIRVCDRRRSADRHFPGENALAQGLLWVVLMASKVGVIGAGLLTLALARSAHAECGDFGGLGAGVGGVVGVGVATTGAIVFPALARKGNPKLNYWAGAGWSLLGGAGSALGMMALNANTTCPDSQLVTPSLVGLTAAGLTTLVWARLAAPEPRAVSLSVATPRTGQGLVLGVGRAF